TTANASSFARRRARRPAWPCGPRASRCRRPSATPQPPDPAPAECSAKPPARPGLPCLFSYLVNRTVEDELDVSGCGTISPRSLSDPLRLRFSFYLYDLSPQHVEFLFKIRLGERIAAFSQFQCDICPVLRPQCVKRGWKE